MTSSYLKKDKVIVIDDSDDGDLSVSITEQESAVTEISRENSPSILSPNDWYNSVKTEPRESLNFKSSWPAHVCKLEPTECSSAQYSESTHPSDSCVNTSGYQQGAEVQQSRMEGLDATCKSDSEENCALGPQSETEGINSMASDVVKAPVKKLRKRKLLSPILSDHTQVLPSKRHLPSASNGGSSSKRLCSRNPVIADQVTAIGKRIMNNIPTTLVSVIKNTSTALPDVARTDILSDAFSQDPVSSSLDNSVSNTVEEQPTSEYATPRRKRKLCRSSDLDTERADDSTLHGDVKSPIFLDSDIVFSHTRNNSRARLCFITQLQAQGFALPHPFILELIQDMMMATSSSRRDIIYSILWSDSECFPFPQTTNKDFLDQSFTIIIDSLMTTKYHHTENANMALHYLLNIFCVNWKNSVVELSSYIATFLSTKVRQMLCEIRKFYDKPPHLFCPHVASTLQQLLCLPLAVEHEPQRLAEFSHLVYNEVFVELSRDKQKIFLNNLSSPYLITELIAAQLTNDYVPLNCRDMMNYSYLIDNSWIAKLFMLVSPYLPDGTEDLVHMLWLMTQLLAKFVQYQRGGIVLSAPICIINPLLAVEPTLLNCTGLMEEFQNRLLEDEIIYETCLFVPEVCYHLKLIMALIEEKSTTSNFDDWLS